MGYELIKIGILPNDGSGDSLRTAFDKINNNFDSLFEIAGLGSPDKINTSSGSQSDTIPSAYEKLNKNFTNIGLKFPDFNPITLNVKDPFRVTFEKVNNCFIQAYKVLAPDVTPTIEIIDPTLTQQTSETVTDASVLSSINITNNYNIYVNNDKPTERTNLLAGPASPVPLTLGPYGQQEIINVGAIPNDGTGDPLRTAFQKINNNFSNLFYTSTITSTAYSIGLTPNQVIFEAPVANFTQGTFQLRTQKIGASDSQGITLTAQIVNNGTDVKFTGYGTTFATATYLTNYDMDVSSGNVRILVNPIENSNLSHFIAAQITFIGEETLGVDIEADGYVNTMVTTEDNMILTTE